MAVVLLALNGVGLGHLMRTTVVSHALAAIGERPVIFSEGKYHPKSLAPFPVRVIPSVWRSSADFGKQVASELWSMAGISLPAVLVEDTHPNPIPLRPEIRRVLLVRPTSFDYLTRLNEAYQNIYSAFLLCDAPDSPTWPYDEQQSRQIDSWKNWHVVGPVYRRPSKGDIRQARQQYNINDGDELCVFTMGGGGIHGHDKAKQDIIRFLRLATEVADVLQEGNPRVRLLFVKGPFFPGRIPIPPPFEVLSESPYMPALLGIAKGAVIRAGFNTTWECLAAGTPFIPLVGTTYVEPVQNRVDKLASLGLLPQNTQTFFFDDAWRAQYRDTSRSIVARYPGTPDAMNLGRLIVNRTRSRAVTPPKKPAVRGRTSNLAIPFVIRVDDVVRPEPALCWLLDTLASRSLRASLEVVPYLFDSDPAFLDRFDPSGNLFEVNQHGYAHVPRLSEQGYRCEFYPESLAPTDEELEVIAMGKRLLETAFPQRFTGGFSPPFDALPCWLPAAWHRDGGKFISCVFNKRALAAPLPLVSTGPDIWNWQKDAPYGRDLVVSKMALQFGALGYAGIVLHPRCLRTRAGKLRLLSLLKYLETGTVTAPLSELSVGKVEIPKPNVRAALLAATLQRKRRRKDEGKARNG